MILALISCKVLVVFCVSYVLQLPELKFVLVCSISEEADDKAVNGNSYNKTGGCIKCDEGTIHANEEGSTCIGVYFL